MPAIQPGMIEISKIFVYLAAKIAKRLLDILAALLVTLGAILSKMGVVDG